jgi:hypothetical protein
MNDSTLFKLTLLILCLPVVIAAGCEDRYRYACQDPNNWETERCLKPKCEIHRDCPDLIFKEDAEKVGIKNDQISKEPQNICNKGC